MMIDMWCLCGSLIQERYRIAIQTEGMIKDLVKNLSSDSDELQMHCASAIFKVLLFHIHILFVFCFVLLFFPKRCRLWRWCRTWHSNSLCSVLRTSKPVTWCVNIEVCSHWFHCWKKQIMSSSLPLPLGPSGSVLSAWRMWLSMIGIRV